MNEQQKHEARRAKAEKRLAFTKAALAHDYPKLDTYAGRLPAGTARVDLVEVHNPEDTTQFYLTTVKKFQGGSLDVISPWRSRHDHKV